MEEIAHQLTGAVVFMKADALPAGTPHQGEQQATGHQHPQRLIQIQENALWSQNATGCLPNENGPYHGKVLRSHQHS